MYTVNSASPKGIVDAIPAKAHAHRALIAAALADGTSTLLLAKRSADIDATINSLRGIGTDVRHERHTVSVTPSACTAGRIDANESGTTLRLMLPVAASVCHRVSVTAKGRLPDRPLEPLLGEMMRHGVAFNVKKPPFTMSGRLQPGMFRMRGDVSSQFFSGLLLAAPNMGHTVIECIGNLESFDYVRLTMQVMADFGVKVREYVSEDCSPKFIIEDGQSYKARDDYRIEGDWSNSAVWLVAAALTGNALSVRGLSIDSVQADRRILHILRDAGVECTSDAMTISVSGKALHPFTADLTQMPDLLPVTSILACGIEGTSAFLNGARLRLKESDRLQTVSDMITALGGTVRIDGEDLYVTGTGKLRGGTVDCANDHRLVMAGTLAALISETPVQLTDAHAVSKSYPTFFDDWNTAGGQAHELSIR